MMTAVLFAALCTVARAVENPSSTNLAVVIQRIEDRAKLESDNDRMFDQRYSYSREKITEFRNGSGDLKKREDKTSTHQANPVAIASPAPAPVVTTNSAPQKNEGVTDTHSNVHGQQFKKNDFLLDKDLLDRFQLKLAGQETVNGRQALMLDFVPVDKDVPERNLKERFINKAAGRIWVDATDYSLVKADMHLTKQVNVAFGLAGSVWRFTYSFERWRTNDGLWFTRTVNWHFEGREVILHRIVDYHEETRDLKKAKVAAAN
jgi:hypothetical protein